MHNSKRSIDHVDDAATGRSSVKTPRTESLSIEDDQDFSQPLAGSGKRKSAGVPRTGQACDRCKNRKIRCDDTEGGCLPCRQNNTECRTTDRITQRATVRGHTEAVERENQTLRAHIHALQQQAREAGVQVKLPTGFVPPPPQDNYSSGWTNNGVASRNWDQGHSSAHGSSNGYQEPTSSSNATPDRNLFASLPPFRPGLSDNYLGVSFNSSLSPIEGTRLSLFGHKVDISRMSSQASSEEAKFTSLQKVLDYIYQRTREAQELKAQQVQLPEHQEEMEQMFNFYMMGLNSFFPLLHRPAMLELIQNLYSSGKTGFRPTSAQTVQIHMICAMMYYQYGLRDPNADRATLEQRAFSHYSYALCHFDELVSGRTIEDICGLTMISIFLRGHPKPGPAWIITNWIFSVAIDIGLHRSANAWPSVERSTLEIERRKRVFWSLMLLHVPLAGKLGRPMFLRLEDYDIEIPEPLTDDMIHEDDPNAQATCTFRGAIEVFKLTEMFSETYAHVYAIRQSTNYEETVRRIDLKLDKWRAELPAKLKVGSEEAKAAQLDILASWISYYENEMLLILHHPALCNSVSREVKARNLEISAKAAEEVLRTTSYLHHFHSTSTSWLDITSYLAAIFTLLFANCERTNQMTSESIASLRKLLESCSAVIPTMGSWLGSGLNLQNAVQRMITSGLEKVENFHAQKAASAANASLKRSPSNSPKQYPAIPKPQQQTQPEPINQSQQAPAQVQTTSQYVHHHYGPSYNTIQHNYQDNSTAAMQSYPYNHYTNEVNSYSDNQPTLMFDASGFPQDPHGGPGPAAWREWSGEMQATSKYDDGSLLLAIGGTRNMSHGDEGQSGDVVSDMSGSMGGQMPHLMPQATMQWPSTGFGPPPMLQHRTI